MKERPAYELDLIIGYIEADLPYEERDECYIFLRVAKKGEKQFTLQ